MWKLLFLDAENLLLQYLMVFGGVDVMHFDVVKRTGQKTTGAARRIHNRLTQLRVDTVDHKTRHGTRGIELTRISGALQVAKDLFVDIAKQMAFLAAAEVDFIELIDHLTQQGAVFHVVIGITESLLHHKSAWVGIERRGQVFQCREQVVVNKLHQRIAGDAFAVRRPATP
ncbi:Uncharacterised protein [Yersinia enterocolitica]|nr:Uncharacterised protein [Yersinia enterocolitica]